MQLLQACLVAPLKALVFQFLAPLPNFFSFCGKTDIEEKLLPELKKYERRIKQVARAHIFNVDDRLECEQMLRVEVCKLFKSKHKYRKNGGDSDWDQVVSSMLKRRAGDFRDRMLRDAGRYLTTNRLQDENGNDYDIDENADGVVPHQSDSISILIEELIHVVDNCDEFTDFDKKFMQAIISNGGGEKFNISKLKSKMVLSVDERTNYNDLTEDFFVKIRNYRNKI